MRKIFALIAAVLFTASVFAQSPQKMSYQAVIRNSSNALVTNTQIGMEINIRQGSPTGTIVYTETQTPTTNANGLVSIEIGGGAGFSTINWANGPYFIETKTAIVPPLTTYTITGTSQLLTVPYALHAKTAETVTGTITETDPVFTGSPSFGITNTNVSNWNTAFGWGNHAGLYRPIAWAPSWSDVTDKPTFATVATSGSYNDLSNKPTIPAVADGSETKVTAGTNITVTGSGTTASPYVINASSGTRYLGEEYLGGIIFYLYIGSDGQQHGLVVSKTESTATWSGSTLVGADRTEDGAYNMNLMPTGAGTARTWVETLGAGWYLPSIDELSILWHNRYHVNKTARAIGSTLLSATANYWSSTEYLAPDAFFFYFSFGFADASSKTSTYSVRAVRAF